jgi:TolB-like protein/Flp pilus assembly protein TadD
MSVAGVVRELQRRNVLRAAILYATSVWALAQGIAQLQPVVGAPDWAARWFLIAAIIGFPFWIAFAWFYEFTPDGIKRESEVVQSESLTRATGRKLDFWIIGALSIAVVLLLTDIFVTHNNQPAADAPVIAEKSVAVLPLVNDSGDSSALYFSDGLSEAFIDALSQFPGLKVIARASSFHFRHSTDPVSVIGAKLGVAHLLEGSVQRAGDVVRISAELINVKDGTALWSQHYDRPYKDLFKLQDDITNAVAAALKTKLLGGANAPPPQSNRPPSGNLDAYNDYLEGAYFLRSGTSEGARKAIDPLTRAIKLDPRYAVAWVGLSYVWEDLAYNVTVIADAKPLYAKAREAADKAASLAPNLAETHNALGSLMQNVDNNWSGAEAEFRLAVKLKPTHSGFLVNLSTVLLIQGKNREALDNLWQAIKIDPLRVNSYTSLAGIFMTLGQLDDAENALHKALELDPNPYGIHGGLSTLAILRGNARVALSEAQLSPEGAVRETVVAIALQIGPDRAAADAALKSAIDNHGGDWGYQIAEMYGLRKDINNMFAWLEKARTLNDPGLQGLLSDPFILPYRHDPRFVKLCAELKLPVPKN